MVAYGDITFNDNLIPQADIAADISFTAYMNKIMYLCTIALPDTTA